MDYKYSLIVPHYNIPHLLRRLLQSVPQRKDFQIIVIDDCSNKNLKELEQLKKDYSGIEWFSTGTNGGGGKARNIGLKHALGEYIIFADADDFFIDNFIHIWDKAIALYNDVDIIYFPIESRESTTGKISWRHLNKINDINSIKSDIELGLYLRYCYTEPWGKLIRRELISKHDITFQESSVANDFLFSVKTGYYAERVQYCKDALFYIYSVREDSISLDQLGSDEKVLTRLKVYYNVEDFAKKNNIGIYPFSRFFIALYLKHRDKKHILNNFCKINNIGMIKILFTSIIRTVRFTFYHKFLNRFVLNNY